MKKITIAEKIKNYRMKNNLSQREFGKMLGVSAQAISKWEREECFPDLTFLPDIATALNCKISDFFENNN